MTGAVVPPARRHHGPDQVRLRSGGPDGRPDGAATALVRVDWRDGARTQHRLADQHPHGTWLEWLADR